MNNDNHLIPWIMLLWAVFLAGSIAIQIWESQMGCKDIARIIEFLERMEAQNE